MVVGIDMNTEQEFDSKPIQYIISLFQTDLEIGLSQSQVSELRSEYGFNVMIQ